MTGENDPLVIRHMAAEDLGRVLRLDQMCFSIPWTESNFRFEIESNENAIPLIAETTRGELVGEAVTWVIGPEAHIATIAVHPHYRRMGIAQLLLLASLREAQLRGARVALLEVRESNRPAQRLYEKFGFQVVGSRPRYYQDNHEDALLMDLFDYDMESLEARLGASDTPIPD